MGEIVCSKIGGETVTGSLFVRRRAIVGSTGTIIGSSRTNVETTRTNVETSRTIVGSTRTHVETTGTNVGSTRTHVETTRTHVETTRTYVETTGTNVETTRTHVETTRTIVEAKINVEGLNKEKVGVRILKKYIHKIKALKKPAGGKKNEIIEGSAVQGTDRRAF